MNTRRSMWYWTDQDWLEHHEKKANQFLAEQRLYSDDDVARIVRYIEACGGQVGGAVDRESLRWTLGQAGKIWLQPSKRRTRRKLNQDGKALRRAIKNAELLCSTLGTEDAAFHAIAVASDLDGIGICTFPHLHNLNHSIRLLLTLYISELRREEKVVRYRRPDTETPPSLASRGYVIKVRRARLSDWISALARIWEISDLPINMGQDFQGFVKECLPDGDRCEEFFLDRPWPINERTVIDWVAKVRQPQERKL